MNTKDMADTVYRVDKFIVPSESRDVFLERLRHIQAFLREQPGCVEDVILEQTGGPGRFNIVTIVIWENPQVAETARAVAAEQYKREGFNPAELMSQLGITADMAAYADVTKA